MEHEFDILITADADGQHSGPDIRRALDTMISDEHTTLVVGTRDKLNRISEHLFSGISGLIFGVADPLSGLKAYRVKELRGLSDHVGANIGTLIVAAGVKQKENKNDWYHHRAANHGPFSVRSLVIWGAENTSRAFNLLVCEAWEYRNRDTTKDIHEQTRTTGPLISGP